MSKPMAARTTAVRSESHSASVFCCYAREDRLFVLEFQSALDASGVLVRGDWEFVDGQDFQAQANRLILECEFFVYVITSASLASAQCARELVYALGLGKRIFPVLREDCKDAEFARVPEAVRLIDFTHLRNQDVFQEGVSSLLNALRTDLTLAITHRRLSVRTDDWEAGAAGFATKEELKVFDAFCFETERRPNALPQPAAAHLNFLAASRQFQRNRSRRLFALMVSILTTISALAAVGANQWLQNRRSQVIRAISDAKGYVQNTPNGVRVYFDSGGNPDKALPLLSQLSGINEVDLGDTETSDRMLTALPKLDSATRLMLYGTPITDAGLQNIRVLRNLKYLDVSDTNITDAGLHYIAGITTLEELDISSSKITSAGLQQLAPLAGTLKLLRASNTPVDDLALRQLQSFQVLKEVLVASTAVTDQGIRNLEPLRSLRTISVEGTAVTGVGFGSLSSSSVEELWAKESQVNNDGLREIAKLSQLKILSVPSTKISEAGLESLKSLTLQELYLGGDGISDDGLLHLGNMTSLHKLWLLGDPVSDRSIDFIAGLKDLKELRLGETKMSTKGIQELQRRLPKADIAR